MDGIDDVMKVKTTHGCLKEGATDVVPMVNEFGMEGEWVSGVKPPVVSSDVKNTTDAIELPQAHHKLSHDGVKVGAKTLAGDNGNTNTRRVKVYVFAWTSAVVGEERRGRKIFDLAEYDVNVFCFSII